MTLNLSYAIRPTQKLAELLNMLMATNVHGAVLQLRNHLDGDKRLIDNYRRLYKRAESASSFSLLPVDRQLDVAAFWDVWRNNPENFGHIHSGFTRTVLCFAQAFAAQSGNVASLPVGESTMDDSLAAFMQRTAKELAHRTNLLEFAFSEMRQIAEEELRVSTRTIDSLNSDEVQGGERVISGGVDRPDTPLDCKPSPVAKPACGAMQHILGDGCADCREFAELGLGESREPLQDKEKTK